MDHNKQTIVFFDGDCGFCQKSVQLCMKLDKQRKLKYSSLQGELSAELKVKEQTKGVDSIIVLNQELLFVKSRAIFKILNTLGGGYKVLNIFRIIPVRLLDFMYDTIARYRKRFFPKHNHCYLPSVAERSLLIP